MTLTIVDSSAILRLCFREGDLSLAERAMSGLAGTSEVATVEVSCAIHARRHRGGLPAPDAHRLVRLASDLLASTVRLTVSHAVLSEAAAIAADHLVRALDAIHLGTAVLAERQQRRRGNSLRFCTADLRQAEIALALFGREQVDVVPPHRGPRGQA